MKIQFCDLCNESVPQPEIAKGKALMQSGRVVCSLCESTMSSPLADPHQVGSRDATRDATRLSAGVGPGTRAMEMSMGSPMLPPMLPPLLPPLPRNSPDRVRGTTSTGGWVAVIALLAASGGSWFLWNELSVQRQATLVASSNMARDLGRVEGNLDRFSLSAQRREDDLEVRLQAKWNQKQVELDTRLIGMGLDLRAATERLSAIDAGLIALTETQRKTDVERSARLDYLLANSMKSRVELEEFALRLERAEDTRAGAPPSQVARVVAPEASPYAAQISDLASDVAGTRWNGVSVLGESGDPGVIPLLIPHMKDQDMFVRMAVARVFGDLGAPTAIEHLIAALEDEEPVVREAAMAALHTLTSRDFRFDPYAVEGERKKRVGAWRDWWKKAREEFLGSA